KTLDFKLITVFSDSSSSPHSWLLLPPYHPATSRNTKLPAILPQATRHQSTLLLATPHQPTQHQPTPHQPTPHQPTPHQPTTRITNTMTLPSPANLMSATSMAAANGGN
ncbi:putative Pupal cuticle protein, partial [Daphnia magna]